MSGELKPVPVFGVGFVDVRNNSSTVTHQWFSYVCVLGTLTSLAVSAYSLTLSTDTILFSTSVQDLTIQLRIPVTCKIHGAMVHFQLFNCNTESTSAN